jgi:hypothetical protein
MSRRPIFDAIVEFFERTHWNFQRHDGKSHLSMNVSGINGKWQCIAQAREAQEQFIFYSMLPINVPSDRRQKIAELLTRANYGIVIGNFEMDFRDGEVRYKTSIDVEGAELTHPLMHRLVGANLMTFDRYLPAIMSALYGDVTPQAAVEEVEKGSAYASSVLGELLGALQSGLKKRTSEEKSSEGDKDGPSSLLEQMKAMFEQAGDARIEISISEDANEDESELLENIKDAFKEMLKRMAEVDDEDEDKEEDEDDAND